MSYAKEQYEYYSYDKYNKTLAQKYIQYNNQMNIINPEIQNRINQLVLALGQVTGVVLKHKLDIEDEAYEEIMNEISEITNDVMSKL